MSFTEDKFIILDRSNRIKKVIYAIMEYLEGKKKLGYLKELFVWLNKYEKYNLNFPVNKNQWEEILNVLKDLLYKENPYTERIPYDDKTRTRKILPIIVLLNDIRSPFNVGSILRNSEAFGVEKVILCGITPDPVKNKKVFKTFKNVNINYEYYENSKEVITSLKSNNYKIYVLDKTSNSNDINITKIEAPLVLILGNEEFGVSKDLLEISDEIFHINMLGIKKSLNVSVACGIALYKIANDLL
jgi:tRNA G18 (ribose-2'-O)-methylase SpoU